MTITDLLRRLLDIEPERQSVVDACKRELAKTEPVAYWNSESGWIGDEIIADEADVQIITGKP